ncbi:MAG TPA: hypothetical protein VE077_08350 [Candidatus Methylomirabilis sp.]|nr:hypothetical protein [Candidatus Methylomirabilis sp.]
MNSVTHAAVPRALVFSTDNRFAKLTDDEGHFEFKVPRSQAEPVPGSQASFATFSGPGVETSRIVTRSSIVLLARKPGYFQSQTGQPWMGGEQESSADLRIELVPEALIVGRVNLPVQDGTERIQVQVYRRQVQEGHVQWVPSGSVTTRANGEFRFADLQQGDYKLFTAERLDNDPLTLNPRGPTHGYPPVYYPAAGDFESAAVIHLNAGEAFQAALTPVKREYYPVKLGVLNAPEGGGLQIQVEPQGHRGPGFSLGYYANEGSIEGMLPNGNYRVEVTQYGESGSGGVLNFSVNGARLEGSTVMLAPNPAIEVRLRDERTKSDNTFAPGARNLLNAMGVKLVPTDEFGPTNYVSPQPPKSPDDETLFFGGTQPGSYRVRAGCNGAAYVAAVNSGGTDLLRQRLVVGFGATVPPLEITIRDDGARVDGNIENWARPGRNAESSNFSGNVPTVVLLPLPDSAGQFCQGWATPEGEFHFAQVAPGDYRVMAFEHLTQDLEYGSTEAMKKYELKGQVLTLEAGQTEHVRLSLEGGSN